MKTGLVANETLGRVEPGKHFKLIIEKAEDIYGNKLEQIFVKNIIVTKVDERKPDVNNWEIILPKSNSKPLCKLFFLRF